MAEIKYKLEVCLKAKKAFDSSIELYFEKFDELKLAQEDQEIARELKTNLRDSIIQRFEFTVEAVWKLALTVFKENFGSDCKAAPKMVFREARKLKFLSEEETELALKMIDDRNMASHTYKEEVAMQILERIPQYQKLISKMLSKLKESL